ncbi:amino acid permease [Candidatus Tisiphia endosymbiont of Nemotelus uliginosus]|uniref:amino acid permease n=1 Tax=Candidatus Tisiphia endosymbiont of Nemotelus uliginosus TaxID=3077926 RepID=UPI0035C8B6B1
MSFFTKKSFNSIKELGATRGLSKTLGAFDLVLLGLGAIIGTGVFVTTGIVAAKYSGPAVMLSYLIAGVTCIFVALAYTELATMLPDSGSIYTYSYVAFGEVFAWLMGSVIILELAFAAGVVAVGWSGYVQAILAAGGIYLPKFLTTVPMNGGIINLSAFLIVVFVFFILYLGTKDSKRLNAILVLVKMAAIFAFIVSATPHFDITNWQNFQPFGVNNMLIGSSILFFAFTGFGTIASTAEECKNPNKDLMIGIIGSLVISTIVYVAIAGLVTGIAPFSELNNDQPLAHALNLNNSKIGSAIVATGAVCGMTTVLMMNIYATSRIFYVIARDGLLPKSFAKIHPKYDSPYITLLIFSALAAILGGFCPTSLLIQLSSMGSLIDYSVVALIVILFRIKMPDAVRPFKCPAVFVVVPIVLIACTYLLVIQIFDTDFRLMAAGKALIIWFIAMFVLYILRYYFMLRNKIA